MRKIDRSTVPAPASLASTTGPTADERLAAAKYYQGRANVAAYNFRHYKPDDVKEALQALFHGKCAYCESKYVATQPVDVEHFRPKGKVEGEPTHRGYWWLAHSWDNLLPSCIHCNRPNRHRLARAGVTLRDLIRERRVTTGKHNSFPVRGTRAFRQGDDHSLEDELLIDPCRRDPALHLQFAYVNGLSLVQPTMGGDGTEDAYGVATVFTFGLNRQKLVEERSAHLASVARAFDRVRRLVQIAATTQDDDLLEALVSEIEVSLAEARDYAGLHQPYSACAQQLLKEGEASLAADLQRLLGNNQGKPEPGA